jgi:4'-phosphopantetheinyl transferase
MLSTVDRPWTSGPLHPLVAEDAVHVWRADLTTVPGDLIGLLCVEERARADRFLSDGARQRWMSSRGVLRALLGGYTGTDPGALRFTVGPHGKPALLNGDARSTSAPASGSADPARPAFNLSHSGAIALYAFTATGSVGVDVELTRGPIEEVALAGRALGHAEARRLEGVDPATRRREFLRAWVRHEAVLKCRGTGIGGTDGAPSGDAPWVVELDMGARATAAVALERPPHDLRCWDWQSEPAASSG